ncbi:caspase family protein [Micromonospora humida]|uniref:caspase family protein n=1 Tax=Micromonospora humida TaxID=2809018 RepID=UPI0033F68F46
MLSDPKKSQAVLVGTYTYDYLDPLPAVRHNLSGLSQLLCDDAIWGLPKSHCKVLRDPETADSVTNELEKAANSANDTLLIYYAGHGLTASRTMELCLGLPGSRSNAIHSTLPYDWVRQIVLASKASRKVVILDCCFSARALVGGMSSTRSVADEASIEGCYVITSSAETRMSLAPPNETHTAFTGELLRLFEDGISDGPDLLSTSIIYENVKRSLMSKSRPLPQQRARNDGNQICFVKNAAHSTHSSPAGSFRTPQMIPVSQSRDVDPKQLTYDESISAYFLSEDQRTRLDEMIEDIRTRRQSLQDSGSISRQTLWQSTMLSYLLNAKGLISEAEVEAVRAVAGWEHLGLLSDPEALTARRGLGRILSGKAKIQKGRALSREIGNRAISILEEASLDAHRALGENNIETLRARFELLMAIRDSRTWLPWWKSGRPFLRDLESLVRDQSKALGYMHPDAEASRRILEGLERAKNSSSSTGWQWIHP